MAIPNKIKMTASAFDDWVQLPENADKRLEFVAGEIIDVPSNPYVSKIAGLILTFINIYLFKNDIGHVTGEAGGYMVAGERYAPDVAFISYEKQAELTKQGYNPNPPDLAISIAKSHLSKLSIKLGNYLAVGTMVWIVRPEKQSIEVYQPATPTKVYRAKDSIKLDNVLPDFELKLSDVFKDVTPEEKSQ